MGKFYFTYNLICHWCGVEYKSKKPLNQGRFCSAGCKVAHHRAYRKYVTQIRRLS